MPERSNGADCKSAGYAYAGSNPASPTRTASLEPGPDDTALPPPGLAAELFGELGIGQGRERLGSLGGADPLVVGLRPLEERLDPQAAQVPWRRAVGALAVGEQVQGFAERVFGVAERRFGDLAGGRQFAVATGWAM